LSRRRTAVVTDSTADLPPRLAAERGITVVPLTVTVDGTSYLDGVQISPAEFYRVQAASESLATTSQPSPGRFEEAYRRLLADHEAVVSVHISEKLSGTCASARQGAELAGAAKVTVIDTEMVSMPLGLLALAAADLADRGAGAAEVVELVERLRARVGVFFMVASLENLRRGGRIGRASALVGSMLQVKPVLTIQDGLVTPLERIRTQERALSRIRDLARQMDAGRGICAIVGHASAEDAARKLAGGLEDVAETLLIQAVGPVVGAHAGAGTVGIGCYPAELFPLGLRDLSGAAAR
jgi:DegV family protein with EDD domain